ncbi:MAG: hypothetical protein K9H16_00850 [Bacteroidales bacterium]|nr:hypothetical protein [Bacteroidales bacterium]
MKTTLSSIPSMRLFMAILICLFIIQAAFAQTTPITLNFSGKDATTGNTVTLQSVMVSNLTQGGDTTLWGDTPSLVLQESYGIFEMNYGQNASFTLEPNFPNPFAGTSTVSIQLQNRQDLTLTMYDQQGSIAASLEQEFSRGAHRFEVAVPQNRLYLLSVSDGSATRTLKLFSTAGSSSRIKYLAWDENTALKTGNETTAFGFQPGDMLEYTVNATGYYEYTTYDNPTESTPYVFEMQQNTTELPPTVTTAAVTNITATTATCGGNVTDEGSAVVTARGVCWSTSPNPTTANNFTNDGVGTGTFTSTIAGLTASTTYYLRAYASNQFGTAYGNEVSFTTTALEPVYVCDSVIIYNESITKKVVFAYNHDGQILKKTYKYLNATYGVWVNDDQDIYTYDSLGNRLSHLSQVWNTEIGSWVNNIQNIGTFDTSGNLLSWTYQNWNGTIGSWVNVYQHLYTYDSQGNQLSEIYQHWQTEIGNWVNYWRDLYTFDGFGNRLSYTYLVWNTNINNWVNDWQVLHTYDASGNMLSYTYQEWNTNIGSWINFDQSLYTYDASGNRLSSLYQEWDTTIGSWVNTSQALYTYDASGNRLSEKGLIWNSTIGSWVNYWQELYTYDAYGNKLSETEQSWNSTIGSWVNYNQRLYTYDASGNTLSWTYQEWNTNIGSWVNDWQYLYTYDAVGNRLLNTYQVWSSELDIWVNSYQYLYTYDASGNSLSEIYQYWDSSYGAWINFYKHEYTYDYAIKKITWMYYVWSGGWISAICEYGTPIILNDNYLWNGEDDCSKLEVWWDEYPSSNNNYKMLLSRIHSDISTSGATDGNYPPHGHFGEKKRTEVENLLEMPEMKKPDYMHFDRSPDFNHNEKPIPNFCPNPIKPRMNNFHKNI